MRARFIHLADVHLGYDQYGSKVRYDDFARAFQEILNDAIQREVDAVLIAGDLFNKRAIDAQTLIQAYDCLQKLKAQGIPVIAIEGNHDRSYYRDGRSWLQFLAWQKLLYLLNPSMRDGTPVLAPWDPATLRGAYLDVLDGRLRIYGLPWFGASTARVIESFASVLSQARLDEDAQGVEYRALLMHTGIEGIVPQLHGLPTQAQLEPLHGLVDYLALGHVHKPFERAGWIYNPGSPETCSAEESAWEDRGYYFVEIDTEGAASDDPDGDSQKHQAHHLLNRRRPFWRFTFPVDGIDDPDLLATRFEDFCQQQAKQVADNGLAPVVHVMLHGILDFDAGSLELARLEEIVETHFRPLIRRVHNLTRDLDFDPDDEGLDGRNRDTWHQLEHKIFQDILSLDARYLPAANDWANTLSEIKQLALQGEDPAVIATRLREARARLLQRA